MLQHRMQWTNAGAIVHACKTGLSKKSMKDGRFARGPPESPLL